MMYIYIYIIYIYIYSSYTYIYIYIYYVYNFQKLRAEGVARSHRNFDVSACPLLLLLTISSGSAGRVSSIIPSASTNDERSSAVMTRTGMLSTTAVFRPHAKAATQSTCGRFHVRWTNTHRIVGVSEIGTIQATAEHSAAKACLGVIVLTHNSKAPNVQSL